MARSPALRTQPSPEPRASPGVHPAIPGRPFYSSSPIQNFTHQLFGHLRVLRLGNLAAIVFIGSAVVKLATMAGSAAPSRKSAMMPCAPKSALDHVVVFSAHTRRIRATTTLQANASPGWSSSGSQESSKKRGRVYLCRCDFGV